MFKNVKLKNLLAMHVLVFNLFFFFKIHPYKGNPKYNWIEIGYIRAWQKNILLGNIRCFGVLIYLIWFWFSVSGNGHAYSRQVVNFFVIKSMGDSLK